MLKDEQQYRGFLIAFEGGDGSGKSTVARRIVKLLNAQGRTAVYLKEPTDGPIGKSLRDSIAAGGERNPQEELRLFVEDRKVNVRENIIPALNRGEIVCIDRYYISTMAYQGAFGIDLEFIRDMNEAFAPKPDLILYFKAPWSVRCTRITSSRADGCNSFETEEYQRKVESCFGAMRFSQMIEIDASMELEHVTNQAIDVIQSTLGIVINGD